MKLIIVLNSMANVNIQIISKNYCKIKTLKQ
jgi:hypothetical protein